MTGTEIRQLRLSLGMSNRGFAKLMGVAPSTVFRWEQAVDEAPRLSEMHLGVLQVLRDRAPVEGRELGDALRRTLVTGGLMKALYLVLQPGYADEG